MRILAVDPGPTESAIVIFEDGQIVSHEKVENSLLLATLIVGSDDDDDVLVIEQIAAMGMPVGAEVFETCFWSGRFAQAWGGTFERVKRHEVKMHLCGNMRAKDANIRQALVDRFGGSAAVGRKKTPGPLYGIAGDQWSALAVAVTWSDKHREYGPQGAALETTR